MAADSFRYQNIMRAFILTKDSKKQTNQKKKSNLRPCFVGVFCVCSVNNTAQRCVAEGEGELTENALRAGERHANSLEIIIRIFLPEGKGLLSLPDSSARG